MKTRNRKINKAGGLTIPSDLRTRFGYTAGSYVAMQVNDNGSILLVPNTSTCFFCGANAVEKFNGVHICNKCRKEIGKTVAKAKATKKTKSK